MLIRWHWPPENSRGSRSAGVAGVEPTASSISVTIGRPLVGGAPAPDVQRFGHHVGDPAAGLSEETGSWKIIWMPVRARRSSRAGQRGRVGAVEADAARGRPLAPARWPARWSTCRIPTRRPGRASRRWSTVEADARTRPAPGVAPLPNSTTRSSTVSSGRSSTGVPAVGHRGPPVGHVGRPAAGPRARRWGDAGPGRAATSPAAPAVRRAAGSPARGHGDRPAGTSRRRGGRASSAVPPAAGARPGSGPGRRGSGGRRDSPAGGAAGRAAARRWRQPGVAGVGEPGGGAQQRLGVGHGVSTRTGRWWGPARRCAGVHDDDVVGAGGHHPEVVGHQDHRHVPLPLQLGQQVEDLGLHGHVEAGGRLVGQQQSRGAGDGDGDHHPLAHAARELAGDRPR